MTEVKILVRTPGLPPEADGRTTSTVGALGIGPRSGVYKTPALPLSYTPNIITLTYSFLNESSTSYRFTWTMRSNRSIASDACRLKLFTAVTSALISPTSFETSVARVGMPEKRSRSEFNRSVR